MKSLAGKSAVVTGAGSGIGQGLAEVLAHRGMRVLVADVEPEAASAVADNIVAAGGDATPWTVDVADRASVEAMAAAALERFGSVEVLCNNAGVSVRRRGVHATYEDWSWVLGVNLWGVVHGTLAFLPGMLASGNEAHIVNTASMNGLTPSAFSAMYSASKYGVVGLTETLANELRDSRVGVTVLCPAAVTTRIGEAERNRPPDQAPSSLAPPHVPSTTFDLSPPLDPWAVGELTVRAILADDLYAFTDIKVRALLEKRFATILEAFDRPWLMDAEPVDT